MVHSLPTTKENCSIPIPKQDESLVDLQITEEIRIFCNSSQLHAHRETRAIGAHPNHFPISRVTSPQTPQNLGSAPGRTKSPKIITTIWFCRGSHENHLLGLLQDGKKTVQPITMCSLKSLCCLRFPPALAL